MSKSLEIQKKKLNLSADGWKDPRRFTSRSSTVTASVRTSASIKEHDPDTVWGLWLIFSLTLASRHGWLLLTDSLTTVAGSPLSRIKKKKSASKRESHLQVGVLKHFYENLYTERPGSSSISALVQLLHETRWHSWVPVTAISGRASTSSVWKGHSR